MKKTTRKLLYAACFFIPAIVAACSIAGYYVLYKPGFDISQTKYVYVYEEDTHFDRLCKELCDSAACNNIKLFKLLASFYDYPDNMKSGRYAVEPGMSSHQMLSRLRRAQQAPVRLTFNNIRLVDDLANRLAAQLMMSNEDLLFYLDDERFCESLGFDKVTIKTMFIPNTYEVYWNTSAEKLIRRMKREHDAFWTEARLKKAEKIRLSPVEISILASIVEEETAVDDEYPVVAGLYINRLHKGILLQADPTVKYAVGDFNLKRILNKHLAVDSPYNTYLHAGLPPGPIRIPSVRAIDAVLNHASHNYLYMCAKEDFSGRHNFAVTLREHNRNADRYRAELNRRGIR